VRDRGTLKKKSGGASRSVRFGGGKKVVEKRWLSNLASEAKLLGIQEREEGYLAGNEKGGVRGGGVSQKVGILLKERKSLN